MKLAYLLPATKYSNRAHTLNGTIQAKYSNKVVSRLFNRQSSQSGILESIPLVISKTFSGEIL